MGGCTDTVSNYSLSSYHRETQPSTNQCVLHDMLDFAAQPFNAVPSFGYRLIGSIEFHQGNL